MTRSANFEYKPIWEFSCDWIVGLESGNFTILCIDVSFEAHTFTFHLALLGFHIGRSLQIVI